MKYGIMKVEFEANDWQWPTSKISRVDNKISRITDGNSTCDIDWENQILHAVEISEFMKFDDYSLNAFYESICGYFDICYNNE